MKFSTMPKTDRRNLGTELFVIKDEGMVCFAGTVGTARTCSEHAVQHRNDGSIE
jgi:hypothetical protein